MSGGSGLLHKLRKYCSGKAMPQKRSSFYGFISYIYLSAHHQAIISTCKQWRQIGFEGFFRHLYLSHATKVVGLCALLDSPSVLDTTSSYGRWTKKIHVGPYIFPGTDSTSVEEYEESIIAVIRHCPKVELFIIERQLGSSFGPIMDALVLYASGHLHTIQLDIQGGFVPKVIWGLSSLPCIIAAHINIETNVQVPSPLIAEEIACPKLPYLQQIFLRGYVGSLLKQLGGCDLPSLRIFTLEDGINSHDSPNIEEFLRHHGSNLVLLDLKTRANTKIPLVLDLCPNVESFVFNADTCIEPHDDVTSTIVNRPHQLTTIGLHGLCHSFGVGTHYLQTNTFQTTYIAHSNDLIMGALNKVNFPKLHRIRVVNRSLLEDLNKSNGPSRESGGFQRWSRWLWTCENAQIRLEDCTGQPLGTLPDIEGEEDSEEDAEDASESVEITEEDGGDGDQNL
jgi:hypothetical protein